MAEHNVTVNNERKRFETTVDGHTAFLEFEKNADRIVLIHTEVPDALEGRGVGSAIVRAALDYAREGNLVVVPRCAFVRSYLERHPEAAELLRIEAES